MWNNQSKTEVPESSPAQASKIPASVPPIPPAVPNRPGSPMASPARNLTCLGSSLIVRGQISGDEDLQIDGKVEGPVSLRGHRLTVGRTAELNSEINAGEVVVYGKIAGNLLVRDRVEIKKGGDVIGDIVTARISIEEGAEFKGRIEIDRAKSQQFHAEPEAVGVLVTGTGS
jgi:cytoskeletal protein CcmA (bactofilin family)